MQTARQGSYPNGTTPFLSLSPVQYSLTEGTSIPAPPQQSTVQQQNTLAPPPLLSVPRTNSINSNNDGSTSLGGPLSSHPVTPLEEPQDPTAAQDTFNTANAFPDSYNWSRPTANSSSIHNTSTTAMSRSTANGTNGTNGTATAPNHAAKASADSNNFDPALPAHIPSRDTSRRPSLVERFLPRLRSSSFMRSRSTLGRGDSSSNLSQAQSTTENGGARGVKRPASPFGFGGGGRSESERPGSRGAASTFPRMVRKKSMDLLSTARRRSGMWGRDGNGSTASAMAEERERERLREAEDAEEANRLRVQAIRAELERKQPPPQLPELVGIGGTGAGGGGGVGDGGGSFIDRDMFANVGG